MGEVDNGGGCAYMKVEGIWEISVPSSHFCCEPKSTQENRGRASSLQNFLKVS